MTAALPSRRAAALALCLLAAACGGGGTARAVTPAERAAITAAIEQRMRDATDLSHDGDVVARLVSLYPDTGRVLSTSVGHVMTSRPEIQRSIETFWANVGRNMRQPAWEWTSMYVDVLSPNAAAFTGTYRIPHRTPAGQPHVVGGAWTAVFVRRGGKWVIVQEHLSDSPAP